jgi:hypothetical protein
VFYVTFNARTIAVSCKSGEAKALSPAREIFYLRGVLDYLGAGTGVAAFSKKPVAAHLRDLGRRLDVLALAGDEITEWCQTLTNGLVDPGYFQESAYEEFLRTWARTERGGLAEYLKTDYWFHRDFRNLQNVIVHLRKIAQRLRGDEPWHTLVVLETASHFCLTLFDLCREVRLIGLPTVAETTQSYLFGGAPAFKARRDLYARVQQFLAFQLVCSPLFCSPRGA